MLVITRKENEAFLIGNNVRITILSVDGNSVKVGIEAPEDVVVLRTELLDRKLQPLRQLKFNLAP